MFDAILPDATRRDLAALSAARCLPQGYYLAGGTAVALQLGHRQSLDLDFFTPDTFAPERLRDALQHYGALRVEQVAPGTFVGIFGETKLGCFHYPYPLLQPTHPYAGMALADLTDLACMKLDAIASRGTRRDFIDLYAICQAQRTLAQTFEAFAQKYRQVQWNRVHLLKSLVYFADAEQDPLPRLLHDISWDAVKTFFRHEVPRLVTAGA